LDKVTTVREEGLGRGEKKEERENLLKKNPGRASKKGGTLPGIKNLSREVGKKKLVWGELAFFGNPS